MTTRCRCRETLIVVAFNLAILPWGTAFSPVIPMHLRSIASIESNPDPWVTRISRDKFIPHQCKKTESQTNNNGIEDNVVDKDFLVTKPIKTAHVPILFQFFANLWRGITLPFPTLRNTDNLPTFSVRECIVAITTYLIIGAVAYTSIFEQWSLVDALYFSVASFSTVGYGDMAPTNLPSKLFTCIFGLGGVAFLGIAIATIGSALVEAELEATKKLGTKHFISIFDNKRQLLQLIGHGDEEDSKVVKSKEAVTNVRYDSLWKTLGRFMPSFVLLFAGGFMIGLLEGWSWLDSIYYSFITAGTLGYGDFSPKTQMGRILAVVFLPLAVASAGEFLGAISRILVSRRQQIRNDHLLHRELDMDFLREMDADGNGKVSRYEYITFMLKAMGVVDEDLLKQLNLQFDILDESKDGSLGVEDLTRIARASGMKVKS